AQRQSGADFRRECGELRRGERGGPDLRRSRCALDRGFGKNGRAGGQYALRPGARAGARAADHEGRRVLLGRTWTIEIRELSMSLTNLLIPTYAQMLRTLSALLDKAQKQLPGPEAQALLSARLAPDMYPLSSQ